MEKSGLILPRLNEKPFLRHVNTGKTKSRKEIVEEKLQRRRNELRAVCPTINDSRNILDIERKAIGALVGPLVEWQVQNEANNLPEVSLRLQQAKVEDWLLRNHFEITRLPRLDPIILTNRGADFSKYTNFVFPAPYCLRFKSKSRHRKFSYEESVQDIRERCPRLLRTQRDNKDLFNLNPVVRVGGGYRRLSWKTAEVLPSIGQTEKDVMSEFTCVTCGINLAVTQKKADIKNGNRFVVTYPNICANCGKPVSRRPKKVHSTTGVVLPPLEPKEVIQHGHLTGQYEDRDFDSNWNREGTTGIPLEGEGHENHTEYDTGFSFTPEESVFITEADGSTMRFTSKHSRHQNHHDNMTSRSDGRSSREMDIIDHSDPKSGMRVRVKKRSSKSTARSNGNKSGEETGNDYQREETGNEKQYDGHDYDGEMASKRTLNEEPRGSSSSSPDSESGYGKSVRGFSSRHRKPKRLYSIYYQERKVKSDSDLSYVCYAQRKRSPKVLLGRRQKSGNQSHAEDKSGVSGEEWEPINTSSSLKSKRSKRSASMGDIRKYAKSRSRSTKKRSQSAKTQSQIAKERNQSSKQRNIRKRRKMRKGEKQRNQSGTMQKQSGKTRNNSYGKLMRNHENEESDEVEYDYPDGYTADSEEESLFKLQARLEQLKKMTQKKSSGKRKSTIGKQKSPSKKQSTESAKKSKSTSAKKPKASLTTYGLDSDSWDSDESLHIRPISDEYSSSEDELSKYGQPRAVSFDISDLPSYRRNAGFYELSPTPRALTFYRRGMYSRKKSSIIQDLSQRSDKDGVEMPFDADWDAKTDFDDAFIGYRPVKNRYTTRKYPKKVYKSVPLGATKGRSQHRSKWNDDDLNENDISLLTAQMQKSFEPKVDRLSDTPDLICKGQSCFRCGTFVDLCEAICTMCGTHCKQAPCTVCRDICEQCGKPKVRCESRVQSRGKEAPEDDNEEMQDEGTGLNSEDVDGEGVLSDADYENESNDAGNEDSFGSGRASVEDSIPYEGTNAAKLPGRRLRRPIQKKQKIGNSKGRRMNRHRASTLDSTDTAIIEETSTIVNSSNEEYSLDEDIQEELHDDINEVTVEKPQKSKHIKSKKKFKSSRQVVSKTVIYKNQPNKSLSKETSIDEVNEELEEEKQENGDESENIEAQSAVQEELPQETYNTELGDKVQATQGEAELASKETEKEKQEKKIENIQKEKSKPQIPKPKLRGVQRVNAAYKERVELNKRLQTMLKEALSNVIAEADVRVRRDSTIDYLAQYRLVDRSKVEVYGRAFALEDEAEKGIISYEQMLLALEGVPTIQGMSRQQLNYVLQVLEIDTFSRISFKMFAVITALCEKVTSLDPFVRDIVDGLDLTETEWKLDLYKNMFYVAGDRSVTFISPGDLRIELKAGGLNQQQEDHVIKHITQSAKNGQISFLDYMAYLPLFLSIHQNICTNALDMSRDKYTRRKAKAMA